MCISISSGRKPITDGNFAIYYSVTCLIQPNISEKGRIKSSGMPGHAGTLMGFSEETDFLM